MKGGANVETNEHYLDEILHKNTLYIELAMQSFSNDKSKRSNTVNDLKEFNNQSLATQAKKGEQLVSLMPAIKKASDLMGGDIVELYTESYALKTK